MRTQQPTHAVASELKDGRLRLFMRQFWAGATQPTLAGLCGAVVVALLMALACAVLITPQSMRHIARYFTANVRDEYADATADLMEMQGSTATGLSVVVMGDSTTREAISDVAHFEQLLSERLGQAVHVQILAPGGLTHWEALTMVDTFIDNFRGVVVMQIAPSALTRDRTAAQELLNWPRLAIQSAIMDDEMRLAGLRIPWRSGNYFVDNYAFFIARPRVFHNLFTGPPETLTHVMQTWTPPTPAQWQEAVTKLTAWRATYQQSKQQNLHVYQTLIARAQSRGVKVALLEEVISPRAEAVGYAEPAARELLAQYTQDVRQFARQHDVAYWDLRDQAGLKDDDFIDHTHIQTQEGRERFTSLLADRVAALLQTPAGGTAQ